MLVTLHIFEGRYVRQEFFKYSFQRKVISSAFYRFLRIFCCSFCWNFWYYRRFFNFFRLRKWNWIVRKTSQRQTINLWKNWEYLRGVVSKKGYFEVQFWSNPRTKATIEITKRKIKSHNIKQVRVDCNCNGTFHVFESQNTAKSVNCIIWWRRKSRGRWFIASMNDVIL